MSAVENAVHWAGKHPVPLALGVFALGAIFLLMFHRSNSGGTDLNGFYAAQASQAASGNALLAAQDQNKASIAIAGIAANRDLGLAATNGGTSVQLANINAPILMAQEETNQQAQKQQFWLAVGQNQLQGQIQPFLVQDLGAGGSTAASAALVEQTFANSATSYHPAH